jgi:hypothetical protein
MKDEVLFDEYTARCPNRAATVRAHNILRLALLLLPLAAPAHTWSTWSPFLNLRKGLRGLQLAWCYASRSIASQGLQGGIEDEVSHGLNTRYAATTGLDMRAGSSPMK